jgi:8-hydroxy-5-deazaflavin:NADPH oxidoreductase
MKIAIIGSGNIGGTLGKKWLSAGHQIILGVRDTANFKGEDLANQPNVEVLSMADAAQKAEVVLIATPSHVVVSIIEQLGNLSGKVVIDSTNAVRMKPEPYNDAFEAFRKLTNAEVVKCFNTTGFENMENPVYEGVAIEMFMAGSSQTAKNVAKQLALETGFSDCIDFGGDEKVLLLEQFAMAWINLAIMQGHGRGLAFKVLRR